MSLLRHSEPPRRKGLKIAVLRVSRPAVAELVPARSPCLHIEAMWRSARRPPLSILLFLFAVAAAAAAARAPIALL